MGNALNMDLTGKKVVVSQRYYDGTEEQRTFLCKDGFGCSPFTRGQAIFGTFADGEKCRIEGHEIEKLVD